MVFRILMRYLANNEQLVQRLSESYPVRRAAQLMVAAFHQSKSFAEEKSLANFTPERFRKFVNSFKDNVQKELESAKEELKRRK